MVVDEEVPEELTGTVVCTAVVDMETVCDVVHSITRRYAGTPLSRSTGVF